MSTRTFRTLTVLLLVAGQLATGLAQNGPPNKDRYIIVLKSPKNGAPELSDHDITVGGGKVEYRVPGRIQVTLPEQAVDAMRKHGGVKYIQKVILGLVPDASAPAELRMTPRISSLHAAAEAAPPTWKSGAYQYDTSGNIYAIGGVAGDGSTVQHRYAYDELSRLKQADTITATAQSQTFTYDPYGNLIQQQVVGLDPVATPVATGNTNRLAASTAHPYTYDAAGNLTADYDVTYAFDPFNMLREKDRYPNPIKQEFYIYTASDERIGVKYGNAIDTPTIWSIRDFSGNVLRQYEGYDQMPGMSWLWIEDYMYRDGQLLAAERVPEEGGRRHFHLDHLGSPRLVTGQDSKEMAEHDYEPFGLESNYQETAGGFDREDPKRFTGHERDYAPPGDPPASTAYLDYMHARYYSASVGRFLSVDPVLGNQRNPQSWNRYAYVMNNPLNRVDPTGLADQCPPPYKCAAPPPPPKPVIPVVAPIQAAMSGIKPPANGPAIKSAASPNAPSSGMTTFAVTAGVSAVVVGGGSASVSLLKSTQLGTAHEGVAATGSVNPPGFGINVGPYITVGAYRGDVADQRGSTKDINWGFGNLTGTLSWLPSGSFSGGSVGWGPTPTRFGFTTSESGTSVVTSKDVQEKLGIDQ